MSGEWITVGKKNKVRVHVPNEPTEDVTRPAQVSVVKPKSQPAAKPAVSPKSTITIKSTPTVKSTPKPSPAKKSKDAANAAWGKVGKDGKTHFPPQPTPTPTVKSTPTAKPTPTVKSQPPIQKRQSAKKSVVQPKQSSEQVHNGMMLEFLRVMIEDEVKPSILLNKWGEEKTMKFVAGLVDGMIPSDEDLTRGCDMMYNDPSRTREDELAEPSTFIRELSKTKGISIEAAIDLVFGTPFDWDGSTTAEREARYDANQERFYEYEEYFDNNQRSANDMRMRPRMESVQDWYFSGFIGNISIIRQILKSDSFRKWNSASSNRRIKTVFEMLQDVIRRTKYMTKYCVGVDHDAANKARMSEKHILSKLTTAVLRPQEGTNLDDTITPKMVESGFAYGPVIASAVSELISLFGMLFRVNPWSGRNYDSDDSEPDYDDSYIWNQKN